MNKLTIYRKPMGESLFEEEFTVEALSQMGNPLERLDFASQDFVTTRKCSNMFGISLAAPQSRCRDCRADCLSVSRPFPCLPERCWNC